MIRYQHLPGRYTPNSRYSTHSSQSPNVNKRNLHHLPTISLFPIHSKTTDKAASSFYLYFLTSIHYKWAFGLTASMKQLFSRSSMTPIFFLSQWLNFSDLTFFFFNYPSASFDPIDYFLLKTLFSKYHRSYLTDYSFSEASFPSPNF